MADTINIATKSAGDTLTSGEFNQVVEKTNAAISEMNENKVASDLHEETQDTAIEALETNKVDKETDKGLSTEDYTTAEKDKLAGIDEGANNYTHPASHSMSIMNETTDRKIMTAAERAKLAAMTEHDKGFFANEAAIIAAHPTGSAGWFCRNGETDTIWVWDVEGEAWVDTGSAGSGGLTETEQLFFEQLFSQEGMSMLEMIECFDDEAAINSAYPAGSPIMAYNRATETLWMWAETAWVDTMQTVQSIVQMMIAAHYEADPTSKLAGIEENANNYTHPASHSMSIMNETETRKIMTAAEREKLINTVPFIKNFTLNESITAGAFVQLLGNGKIEATKYHTNLTFGTETYFDVNLTPLAIAFDPNTSNKFVLIYCDNSGYGKAIIGTVDGTTISFGSPIAFNNAETEYISVAFDPNTANKFVVAYQNGGNSNYGTAIIGTVDGTTISFGSPIAFNSAETEYISVAFDPNTANKFVVAAYESGTGATAIIGTVDGTTISFGSPTTFNATITSDISLAFDPNTANKFVVAYQDNGNSNYGTAIIGTVDGTTISFGSEAVFCSAATSLISLAFDPNTANRFVVAYRRFTGSLYNGRAIVGTVDGTTISFGSEVAFSSAGISQTTISFDPNTANKFVVAYKDGGNSNYGTAIIGTVDGTTISFESEVVYGPIGSTHAVLIFDPYNTGKFILSYYDYGESRCGTLVGFLPYSNLSASKLLGTLKESGSADESKPVQLLGSVLSGLSGLTIGAPYYLQNDGTLSTDSGGVKVGRAISPTEMESIKTF